MKAAFTFECPAEMTAVEFQRLKEQLAKAIGATTVRARLRVAPGTNDRLLS